jgi:hypothetical protein
VIRVLPRVPLRAIDRVRASAPGMSLTGSRRNAEHGGPLDGRAVRPGYLFSTGCERSGTTALARLLQSHPAVAMGMERY